MIQFYPKQHGKSFETDPGSLDAGKAIVQQIASWSAVQVKICTILTLAGLT